MSKIIVIASYTPSLLNFRGELLRKLVMLGHDVLAASPDPDRESLARLHSIGVRHHSFSLMRAGLSVAADSRTLVGLSRIMKRERPDHVLAYTVKPVIYGCLAARWAGVQDVHAMITGLGTAFQGDGFRRRVLNQVVRKLYAFALSGCRNIFFQNSDDCDLFLDLGLVDSQRTLVINGSGVDLDHFAHMPLIDPARRFLLIARLIKDKGVREYVSAAREVKSTYPDSVFKLVGYSDDHLDSILASEVADWQDEGVIDFCGRADDVRPFLADTSVYCLPSYREGLPRSVLEAMAVGRAILTTDAPGCRETVIPGKNGELVPVRDAQALAMAMRRMCSEPQRLVSMGEESRRLAECRFDVHKVNAMMIRAMGLAAE